MSYRILYERRFIKDLKAISESKRSSIRHRLEWLAENILIINHVPLKDQRFNGVYRLRIGRWRIFYRLDHKQETIFVLSIKDRKEAYK